MKMNGFVGTGGLIRLILRRDRLMLAVWILVVGLIPVGNASGFHALYPTEAAIEDFIEESLNNPTVITVLGPVLEPTLGGLTAWRSALQVAIFMIVPTLVLLIRHTRGEEEAGRSELLGSTAIGQHAPLTAAFVVLFGANLLIGSLIAATLLGIGLPARGAVTLGLSLASAGWLFIAIAAVTAQLTESAGSARGISLAILGLFLLMRFIGNSSLSLLPWLSWLSPLSWISLTRAFAGEQWWVFSLIVTSILALTIVAYLLSARRDLGAGILPVRPGPTMASPRLSTPLALAWRLNRATLFSWIIGGTVFGIALGSVGQSMSIMTGAQVTEWMMRMGVRVQNDALLQIMIYIFSLNLPLYAIQTTLQLRTEESAMRADFILTTPISRLRWAASHLSIAFVGSAVVSIVFGLGVGLVYGASVGNIAGEVPRLLARVLMALPAVWVMAAITVALYGLLPRLSAAGSWVIFMAILLLEVGWEVQLVNQTLFNLSPFAHVHWTSVQIPVLAMAALAAVAVLLTGVGLLNFQRRDIG